VAEHPQEVSLSVCSHPFATLPSQFENDPEQESITQTPAVQCDDATFCKVAQLVEHVPHLFVVVFKFISQPSDDNPLQLANPGEQVSITQVPAVQCDVVTFERLPQLFPQVPQLLVLVDVDVSHPFVTFPSQLAKFGEQVFITHVPEEQVTEATFGRFAQLLPQVPQLFVFEDVLISHPSDRMALQSAYVPEQIIIVQVLATQADDEFGTVQFEWEHPQFSTPVGVRISQPSA
jgi:hypothetical protein